MLRPKKKISKKELKEDTLVSTYVTVTTFYEDYKREISIGITVLVVAVAAVYFILKNQGENQVKATTELGQVFTFYDNGQYQLAIDGIPERGVRGLSAIVQDYGSTRSGELARFYLANAYYALGKYDDALKNFEDFGPPDDLLALSRLAGIAQCYEAKGMHREAADYFERAATKNTKDIEAADNLSNAARNYAEAGEKEKALDLFKKLKKNYPTTAPAREADRYIAQLSV